MIKIKKYPFVKQLSSKTCAVASLQMIIKYYKGYVSNNYLEEITKTTKNGTIAFNLIEAAKQIGFDSKGLKLDLDNLKQVSLPCIVHVTLNKSFNHYMVIYEINYKKKYLVIADPSKNISKWAFNNFEKIWNNIVITFVPIKPIPVLQNEVKYGKLFKNLYARLVKSFSKTILFCYLSIILSIISSFAFTILLDLSTFKYPKSLIVTTFIVLFIILLYKNLFEFIRNKFLIIISHKLDWFITNDIFKKIISLPYRYYRNHTTGDIVSRINDLKIVKDLSSQFLILIMVDIPLMFISIIILFFINRTLFYYIIFLSILIVIINLFYNYLYKKIIPHFHEENASVNNNMIEKISGFETIKGLGIEKETLDDFRKKYYSFQSTSLRLNKIYNAHSILKSLINDLGSLIIFFIGSLLILNEKMSIGSLIAFNTLFAYYINPIKTIAEMSLSIKEAKDSLKRIFAIIITDKDNGIISKNMEGNIEIKNLNYSYDSINNILSNINIKIKMGEKVLILGESGTGKSTLVKLLKRDYIVPQNSVFIDNIDINNYTLDSIKENICYLSQNEMLFTGNLLDNLKLNRDIDNKNITEIINLCYIKDIFKNSNLGLQTLIEENGFNLSGGERQRIILGRSLLKSFNILIIDEGLNQVDISLERKILKNIIKKYKNKTIIVISHRLENMDLFNHVIKFSNNKVIEDLRKNV